MRYYFGCIGVVYRSVQLYSVLSGDTEMALIAAALTLFACIYGHQWINLEFVWIGCFLGFMERYSMGSENYDRIDHTLFAIFLV